MKLTDFISTDNGTGSHTRLLVLIWSVYIMFYGTLCTLIKVTPYFSSAELTNICLASFATLAVKKPFEGDNGLDKFIKKGNKDNV